MKIQIHCFDYEDFSSYRRRIYSSLERDFPKSSSVFDISFTLEEMSSTLEEMSSTLEEMSSTLEEMSSTLSSKLFVLLRISFLNSSNS